MQNYLAGMSKAAENLKQITFYKFFFPIITVLGLACFFYFGIKGIVKKETLMLGRIPGTQTLMTTQEYAQRFGRVKGTWAVILGVIYLIVGCILGVILIPISYFIVFSN